MIGNNTLHLNQATMIEAVQLLMNKQFKDGEAPIVKSVKIRTGSYPNDSGTFEVEVSTVEKAHGV